ncbi:MAG: hypothetical protein AB2A00_42865 [Myxococcota bacterium]
MFRWAGIATVPQLERMLDDAERATRATAAPGAEELLAKADRMHAARQHVEAATLYRQVLETAPPHWPARPRAVESWLLALWGAKRLEECAEVAARHVGSLPRSPSLANAASLGLLCAVSASGQPWQREKLPVLEGLAQEALRIPDVLADDRSGLYELLVEARAAAGDNAGARQVAGQWLGFLQQQVAQTTDPELRAAFDSHVLSASLALGEPARAVERLMASERDLPGDYNAPARLAVAYRELGKLEEAQAAAERALSKVYGPRKLRVMQTLADIQKRRGDLAGMRKTLTDAVAFAQGIPVDQRPRGVVEAMEAQLKAAAGP